MIKKDGRIKTLDKVYRFLGYIVTDKYIYYHRIKGTGEDIEHDDDGIYRMDLNGKNKIKIGNVGDYLYKSKNSVFASKIGKEGEFYTLEGKKIRSKVYFENNFFEDSNNKFYLKRVKKMVRLKKQDLQIGSYKKGKWRYKTVKSFKKEQQASIVAAADKYMIISFQNKKFNHIDWHLYDIDGNHLTVLYKDFKINLW